MFNPRCFDAVARFYGERRTTKYRDYQGIGFANVGTVCERRTTKYRDCQGIFAISAPAHCQLFNHKLYCVAKSHYFIQNKVTQATRNKRIKNCAIHALYCEM